MLPQEIRHQTIKLTIFSHLIQVSNKAFEPGCNISSHQQYASFQVHCEDKQRVTLKLIGDVFLVYSVCEDGYTINFYTSNFSPPNNWIDKGYSPTHSQILFMLYALPDQYYTCNMDNIFISENFLRSAYSETKSETIVHGVCQNKIVDYPTFLYNNIIQNREKYNNMRGGTNTCVLEVYVECPDLVVLSVYDTNPVHFLSMSADKLVWNINEK